jgi:bacillithiol biosynthesis cysteine-adding enzyme BshC
MAISNTHFDLKEIKGFSALLKSYLAAEPALRSLYGSEPSKKGLNELLEKATFPQTDRHLLAEVIAGQYHAAKVVPGSKTNAHIQNLEKKNTYTVCTGHQLCLFTGPLYFIYKIISTINLAEALQKDHPESHFVPVYWLASEDHDFEELNHIQLFGKTWTWSREEALIAEGGSIPAGKIPTASLKRLLDEIVSVFGVSEYGAKLKTLLYESYLEHDNLSDATRCFVNALLGEYGLVILDANDSRLKARFSELMQDELIHATNVSLVLENKKILEQAGFQGQVNPREINLFYMTDTLRSRIEKVPGSDQYQIVNTKLRFGASDLLAELKNHPERFSPNVVLRPLYQQLIMPNVAYVGGPGELAYWLEYKKMFDYHGILFPVLMPRNFGMWVDAAASSKMKKLNLHVADLSHDLSALEKDYVTSNSVVELNMQEESKKLAGLFGEIGNKAASVDPTLKALAEAELQKSLNALKNLEAKMTRAEKQKYETGLNQIKALKEKLYPGNNLQERVDNFIPIYLKHGPSFIETLKNGLNPFDFRLNVFSED